MWDLVLFSPATCPHSSPDIISNLVELQCTTVDTNCDHYPNNLYKPQSDYTTIQQHKKLNCCHRYIWEGYHLSPHSQALSRLQFLIACSVQKLREKAWYHMISGTDEIDRHGFLQSQEDSKDQSSILY